MDVAMRPAVPLSPPAERHTMSPTKEHSQDAGKMSFGVQMVFTIVGVVVSAYGASWQAQATQREAMAELRSDVRDIRTTMQHQKELAAKDSQMWEERFTAMKEKADSDAELRRALLKQYEQNNADFQKKVLAR